MKISFLLFLFINLVFASSMEIFNNYRLGNKWQQDVDKFLYSDEYISYLLKNKNVKFGYFDNPTNIIVCYKEKKKLDIYSYNNKLQLKTNFSNILTGKNTGDK